MIRLPTALHAWRISVCCFRSCFNTSHITSWNSRKLLWQQGRRNASPEFCSISRCIFESRCVWPNWLAKKDLRQAYLSHFIKEQLHITFQDYLAALRLEAAFSLLNSTSMSLTDISYECGFSDPKYFNHYFHKQFGVYPRQWPRHQTQPKLSKPQSSPNQLQYILPQEQSISIIKNLVDEECS